jgi:hypothetical protein
LPAFAVPYWLFWVSNLVDVEIKAELLDEVEGRRVVLNFIGRGIIGALLPRQETRAREAKGYANKLKF